MLAPEAAACRGYKSAGSSLLHILRGAARNVSGNAMNKGEDKVSISGDASFARERSPLVVVSFYKFANLPNYEQKRTPLKELCETNFVSGGLILAPKGINGSLCGTQEVVEVVMSAIQSNERLANLRQNETPARVDEEEIHNGHSGKFLLGAGKNAPFRLDHMCVKLKKEANSEYKTLRSTFYHPFGSD